jgi:hypothetical protein
MRFRLRASGFVVPDLAGEPEPTIALEPEPAAPVVAQEPSLPPGGPVTWSLDPLTGKLQQDALQAF